MTKDEQIELLTKKLEFYRRDYVTGLYQRHDFMRDCSELLKARHFWLTFHDVNGLHEINRLKGYYAGDALLKQVANNLQLCVPDCLVYRLSGDEFAVVYYDEPSKCQCDKTTHFTIHSKGFDDVEDMIVFADKEVSLIKKEHKLRRREDI